MARVDTPWAGLIPVAAGGVIAAVVTVALSLDNPVWAFLVPGAVVAVLPAFFVRNGEDYWLAVFFACSAFDVQKAIGDGQAVKDRLGLLYNPHVSQLVPEIALTDLPLWMLLGLWMLRLARHERRLQFPPSSWLLVGFLAWTGLTAVFAWSPYLAGVEWTRQVRFFLTFMYAANSKIGRPQLKIVLIALLAILSLQTLVVAARYTTGFSSLTGDAFGAAGDLRVDDLVISEEGGDGGSRRSYGTMPSPRGTATHLLLLLPLPILASLVARSRAERWFCILVFLGGVGGLVLTFSRAALVSLVAGGGAGIVVARRWNVLSPRGVGWALTAIALVGLFASPVLVSFLRSRPTNTEVRLTQYDAALRMIIDNPVVGVGLNNSAAALGRYSPRASSLPLQDATRAPNRNQLHSQHLALLAETGFLGYTLYAGFFLMTALRAYRLTVDSSVLVRLLAATVLMAGVTLTLQAAIDPINGNAVFSVLLLSAGLLVGLERSREDEAASFREPVLV